MAAFTRLDVLNTIIKTGLVPVFYHPDVEVAKKVARACSTGGCPVLEFTNRGDFAPEVFKELSRYLRRETPGIVLGVGSVIDEATAALVAAIRIVPGLAQQRPAGEEIETDLALKRGLPDV